VIKKTLKIAAVCTGNICRSPMAEVVLRQLLTEDPLPGRHVEVTSAGTANWHVGSAMDPRARAALDRAGFLGPGTSARLADQAFVNDHDLILAMTREHVRDVERRRSNPHVSVALLRDYVTPHEGLEVPDPYYGDDSDFDRCLAMIVTACRRVVATLRDSPEA